MFSRKAHHALVALLALAGMLFISACSVSVTGPSQNNLTVGQVLQKSIDTMQKLKTAHFAMTLNGSAQGNFGNPTATSSATPVVTPIATVTPSTGSVTFNLSAAGDQDFQKQQQSMRATFNQNLNLTEVVSDNKVYVQNQKGQWYVIDASKWEQMVGNPLAGVKFDTNTLLGLAAHAKITDHGDQTLNGQSLRHITADLDKEGLRQLLKSNSQLSNTFGQQNIDNVIDHTRTFQSTLDLWIDETQFYLHRTEVKINLNADVSLLTPPAGTTPTASPTPTSTTQSSTVATKLDTVVDLSNFNKPVTITVPANATPTDNPLVIFQQ